MLMDTAHRFGLAFTDARSLSQDERKKALAMGLEKSTMQLSMSGFLSDEVTFERLPSKKRQRAKVRIGKYSESGEYIGEGYYDVWVTLNGKALKGHTKYTVNGILARDCPLTRPQAQILVDKVFERVLSSLESLKLPKRPKLAKNEKIRGNRNRQKY